MIVIMLMMIPQYKTAAKFAQFVQCCKTFMHLFDGSPISVNC